MQATTRILGTCIGVGWLCWGSRCGHSFYGWEFGAVAHGPPLPRVDTDEDEENACIDEWLSKGMSRATLEYLVAFRPDLDRYLPRMRTRVKRSVKHRGLG